MPSRRDLLAAVGAAGLGSLGGCVDAVTDGGPTPGADEDTDWPLRSYDRFGRAYAPDAAVPRSSPSERFAVDLDGDVRGRPIVAGGRVFQTTEAGIEAFDATTGRRQWTYAGPDGPLHYYPAPAVHDGSVYVGTDEAEFVALNASTGRPRWSVETDGRVVTPPVVRSAPSRVYAATDHGEVFSVAPDGNVNWRNEVFGTVEELIAPGTRGVLVGTTGGEVLSLGVDTGYWRTKLRGRVRTLAAGGHGTYVGTSRGVFGLRGTERTDWDATDVSGPLALVEDAVFASADGGVSRLDGGDGSREWTLGSGGSPVAAGDTLYVGGDAVVAHPLSGGVDAGIGRLNAVRFRHDVDGFVTDVVPADGALFAAVTRDESASDRLLALE